MFTRKTMEQMVMRMIQWGRASSKNLTDFRPGSKIRTIYEAVAIVIEDMYDKLFRTMRLLIEENIYAIFGFNKISSIHATGTVRFFRSTVADRDYLIADGTLLQTQPTSGKAPGSYRTVQDAVLLMGTTYIDVNVVSEVAGTQGNTGAHTIVVMAFAVPGIEGVSNPSALSNGEEEETKEVQKKRFQRFIEANARAVLPSIEYGATLATVLDEQGVVVERVVQAKALEDLPARKGEVDVYIWNGVNGASVALRAEAQKHITGYYAEDGTRVYGYKSAGIWLNMYVAPRTEVKARLVITTENWLAPSEAVAISEREMDSYFAGLSMGQSVVQTALEARIKNISGIYDVKLYLSTNNGTSYHTDNIAPGGTGIGIAVLQKPIDFQVTSLPQNQWGD